MLRASLIAALALSILAPAGIVAADDCMCFAVPDGALRVARMERIEQSFEVGPFFSSDGVALSSHLERVSLHLERERRLPAGEILWCWSPSDPRCSPGDPPPDDGPRAGRSAQLVGVVVDRSTRWPSRLTRAVSTARDEDDRPRDGVRARVDRPPRA